MAYNPGDLFKCSFKLQAALGTAESADLVTLKCRSFLPPTGRQMHRREASKGAYYTLFPAAGSQAGQEFTISMDLQGTSSTVPVADPTATPVSPQAKILESLLGGRNTDGYEDAAVAAGSSASSVMIESTTPSAGYDVGQGIGFTNGTLYEIGWIKTVTDGGGGDHTLALLQAMDITPQTGSKTYGSHTLYLTTADPLFFTIIVQSLDINSRMILEGCAPKSAKISMDPNGLLKMDVTFIAHSFTATSDAALSDYTFDLPELPPFNYANGAKLWRAGSKVPVETLSIQIDNDIKQILNPNDAQGVSAYATKGRTVKLECTAVLAGTAPTITPSTSGVVHVIQGGSTPGNMWGLCMPSGVHMEPGALEIADGLWAQKLVYEQGQYTGDTGSTAPGDTTFRAAIL